MDPKNLNPDQIMNLLRSMNMDAAMSSEDAIDQGVGSDYRKRLVQSLKTAKQIPQDQLMEGVKMMDAEAAPRPKLHKVPSPMIGEATGIIDDVAEAALPKVAGGADDVMKQVGKQALKKLPAAALGGVGLMASAAAEAADTAEVGESAEEEAMMLSEIDAMKNYDMSPAARDSVKRKKTALEQVKAKYLGR